MYRIRKDSGDYLKNIWIYTANKGMLTPSEYLKFFRMKAEGKLKVKERKVFLCKELKNIKLNEN